MFRLGLGFLVCLSLGSCAKSRSSAIASSEIYVVLAVRGNSLNSVTCRGEFRVGGGLGTYLELDGADSAVCSDGTTEVTLQKTTDLLGVVSYSASGLTYEVGRTYTITFRRGSTESHTSTAVLPVGVVFTGPTANSTHKKGTDLNYTWAANSGSSCTSTFSWSAGGTSSSSTKSEPDDGGATVAAIDTQTTTGQGQTISGNVSATLTLRRAVSGTPTTTLKGGTMEGQQEAELPLTLVD